MYVDMCTDLLPERQHSEASVGHAVGDVRLESRAVVHEAVRRDSLRDEQLGREEPAERRIFNVYIF